MEVVKQNESHTSIVSDWATQVRDKVSRVASSLWEKKSTLLLGIMLASARRLGADARPVGGGTALRPLDRSNATSLPPVDWKGFNNLSHQTAFETLAHWRKLQAVPDPNTILRCLRVDSSQMKVATVPVPGGTAAQVDGTLLVLNSCPNDVRNARADVEYIRVCAGKTPSLETGTEKYPIGAIAKGDVGKDGPRALAVAGCTERDNQGRVISTRPPYQLGAKIGATADVKNKRGQDAKAVEIQQKSIRLI